MVENLETVVFRSNIAVMRFDRKSKEVEILQRLSEGQKASKIASDLKVSTRVVEWAIMVLKGKYNAENVAHLVGEAFRKKVIH